mgnify:CR=1 FL=1
MIFGNLHVLAQTPQQKVHGRNTRCHTSADGFLAHRCRYALACAYIYFNVCEKIFVVPINMPEVADLFDNEDAAKDFAQI